MVRVGARTKGGGAVVEVVFRDHTLGYLGTIPLVPTLRLALHSGCATGVLSLSLHCERNSLASAIERRASGLVSATALMVLSAWRPWARRQLPV
jgi:hypothetical protein